MMQVGKQQNQMAAALGVHLSTIGQEFAGNVVLRDYRSKRAQKKVLQLRLTARKASQNDAGVRSNLFYEGVLDLNNLSKNRRLSNFFISAPKGV
jgi:hypothetical protein